MTKQDVTLSDINLNTEPPPDGDTSDDVRSVFPAQYAQTASVCLGLESCSIVRLRHVSPGHVFSLTSTGHVYCHSVETSALSRDWSISSDPGHRVSDISSVDSSAVLTSSSDGCVRLWDKRQSSDSPVIIMSNTSSKHSGPPSSPPVLSCVSVRSGGDLVVAGSELLGQDSYLLFWDVRSAGKMLGGYWSVHSDDVTDLLFTGHNTLVSGSTDGLVNVLDISKEDEDEALVTSLNTGDSVAQVSSAQDSESIMVRTHTESVVVWSQNSNKCVTVSRDQLREGIHRKVSDYIYTCGVHVTGSGSRSVLVGSRCVSSPCLRLVRVTDNGVLEAGAELVRSGGSVRCAEYLDNDDDVILTGGEDGVIRVWRQGQDQDDSASNMKIQTAKTKHKPYDKSK